MAGIQASAPKARSGRGASTLHGDQQERRSLVGAGPVGMGLEMDCARGPSLQPPKVKPVPISRLTQGCDSAVLLDHALGQPGGRARAVVAVAVNRPGGTALGITGPARGRRRPARTGRAGLEGCSVSGPAGRESLTAGSAIPVRPPALPRTAQGGCGPRRIRRCRKCSASSTYLTEAAALACRHASASAAPRSPSSLPVVSSVSLPSANLFCAWAIMTSGLLTGRPSRNTSV